MDREAIDLAVITFAHKRPIALDIALKQMLITVPERTGLITRCVLMPDRVSPPVQQIVDHWAEHPSVVIQPPSLPILSPEHGQQWCRARNEGLAEIDKYWIPRWVCDWNDEWLLGPGWEEHLRPCLDSEDVDAWIATSLFIWDSDQQDVNMRQRHQSPLFGRHQPGWRRNPALTNQVARQIEDPAKATHRHLPFFLLDYGTTSLAERERVYKACCNAGKIDQYVNRFVEMPVLQPLQLVLEAYTPEEFHHMQVQLYG